MIRFIFGRFFDEVSWLKKVNIKIQMKDFFLSEDLLKLDFLLDFVWQVWRSKWNSSAWKVICADYIPRGESEGGKPWGRGRIPKKFNWLSLSHYLFKGSRHTTNVLRAIIKWCIGDPCYLRFCYSRFLTVQIHFSRILTNCFFTNLRLKIRCFAIYIKLFATSAAFLIGL
jgi:hypothetical protein